MPHELRLADDVADDATLTLGAHPDGELAFEDGTATVEDETLARRLAERYVRLEYVDGGTEDESDSSDGDSEDDDEASPDAADDESVSAPVDPGEYTNTELEAHLDEKAYSDAELRALLDAEDAGRDRTGATDAIEAALEE